jgi:hypothetical protein
MKNPTLYRYARRIHRYLVVIVLILSVLMMTTGYFMHKRMYFGLDPVTVRYLHGSISTLFSIVLGGMLATGVYLFLFPYLR